MKYSRNQTVGRNNLKSVLSYVPRTILTVYAEKNQQALLQRSFHKTSQPKSEGKTMAGK